MDLRALRRQTPAEPARPQRPYVDAVERASSVDLPFYAGGDDWIPRPQVVRRTRPEPPGPVQSAIMNVVFGDAAPLAQRGIEFFQSNDKARGVVLAVGVPILASLIPGILARK